MSISYRARFDRTELLLPQILEKLEGLIGDLGIRFQNRVFRLVEHQGGPTIDVSSFEPVRVQGLGEVDRVAARWWGVGLQCSSLPLQKRLGRGDWTEVYFQLFRAPDKRWTLRYSELKSAQRLRLDVEDVARELYELQLRLCANLGFRLSIYDEEDDNLPPVATLKDIEHRLERCKRGELGCSVVVASTEMGFKHAQGLVGVRANLVRLSTTGHILFPFLLPDEGA
ncbi:hypothetical protein [Archangium sp.]|uniref:hypothetical protein n=1 Tax=Archangium sp. TaxID=1872627 RepID=UPI002D5F63A5|nr:hypothetical protein [Archangium sp.]HYO59310.1 hypothetical protein [Archangium sp.]